MSKFKLSATALGVVAVLISIYLGATDLGVRWTWLFEHRMLEAVYKKDRKETLEARLDIMNHRLFRAKERRKELYIQKVATTDVDNYIESLRRNIRRIEQDLKALK
jgi:hypothetical protein